MASVDEGDTSCHGGVKIEPTFEAGHGPYHGREPLSQRTWGAVSSIGGIDAIACFGTGRIVERRYRRG